MTWRRISRLTSASSASSGAPATTQLMNIAIAMNWQDAAAHTQA
jgi:hypothetical protein